MRLELYVYLFRNYVVVQSNTAVLLRVINVLRPPIEYWSIRSPKRRFHPIAFFQR